VHRAVKNPKHARKREKINCVCRPTVLRGLKDATVKKANVTDLRMSSSLELGADQLHGCERAGSDRLTE